MSRHRLGLPSMGVLRSMQQKCGGVKEGGRVRWGLIKAAKDNGGAGDSVSWKI